MAVRRMWPIVCLGGFLAVARAQETVPYVPPPQVPSQPQVQAPAQLPAPPNLNPPPTVTQQPSPAPARQAPDDSRRCSTGVFTAELNGPVTDKTYDASDEEFTSTDGDVSQSIYVKKASEDVSVDHSTTDLHAGRFVSNTGVLIGNEIRDQYQGHPDTYALIRSSENGRILSYRVMFIVINPRVMLRIKQVALWSFDDQHEWNELLQSIVIK